MRRAPTVPLSVHTGITVLNTETTVHEASLWALDLEERYIQYYGESCISWTCDDMHELDRDATVALDEVLRAHRYPPLDTSLLKPFLEEGWRKGYTARLQQINR